MPPVTAIIDHLRRLVGHDAVNSPDAELLRQFGERQDQDAFAALVHRYGSLVMGACRRILREEQDAEDAFQATFVILARKASTLVGLNSLPSWLYTVACNTARDARRRAMRRRERQVVTMPEPTTSADAWNEIKDVLDDELKHLPNKYRQSMILCYLAGKTTAEAAQEIGCSPDVVRGRLERAKELLRGRLAKRGVAMATGILGTALAQNAEAAVSGACVQATILATVCGLEKGMAAGNLTPTVAALVQGGMRQMFIAKVKRVATVMVSVFLVGASVGLLTHHVLVGAAQQPQPGDKAADKDASKPQAARAAGNEGEPKPVARGKIAYYGAETDKKHNLAQHALFVVDPKGGPPDKVLGGIYGTYNDQWEIKWLPGRDKFVVSVDVPQEERFGLGVFPALWLVDAGSRSADKTTERGAQMENGSAELAVSQDGRRIAYSAWNAEGGSNLHVMDSDGRNPKQLTRQFTKVWFPAWSPDGKYIVFVAFNAKEIGTYLIAPDGTGLIRLSQDLAFPRFTPDGKTIIAAEYDSGFLKNPRKLVALDLATKRVTAIAEGLMKRNEATWGCPFQVSPDGKRVALVHSQSCDLVVVDVDGRNEKVVANGLSPSWSPDGKRLVYQGLKEHIGIWVVDVETKKETQVAREGMYPSWSR